MYINECIQLIVAEQPTCVRSNQYSLVTTTTDLHYYIAIQLTLILLSKSDHVAYKTITPQVCRCSRQLIILCVYN